MPATIEELEQQVRELRAILRRSLVAQLEQLDQLERAGPRPAGDTPMDEPPAPADLERASANALENLRRVRQHRRQRG